MDEVAAGMGVKALAMPPRLDMEDGTRVEGRNIE